MENILFQHFSFLKAVGIVKVYYFYSVLEVTRQIKITARSKWDCNICIGFLSFDFFDWDIKLNWLVPYFTEQWIIYRKAWTAVNLASCKPQLNRCFHGLWFRVWRAAALDLLDWMSATFSAWGLRAPAGTRTWRKAEMGYSQRVYNRGLACLAEVCRFWVWLEFGWIKSPR